MPKERNKAIPAVYLLLKKAGEILLLRRQGSGYYNGWYSLPAGHVEAGELPLGALIRETSEEIGITIDPQDVKFVHMMYREKADETGDRTDLFFEVEKWTGEIVNVEPHKCDDVRWFPIDALPEKTIRFIKEAINNRKKAIQYSEIELEHPATTESKKVNTR